MNARNMLRDLIANTADDYLDARYGRDRDNDAVVELILGTRLREAADELVAFCPDHGNRDTAFIACQCLGAEDLRRTTTPAGGQA